MDKTEAQKMLKKRLAIPEKKMQDIRSEGDGRYVYNKRTGLSAGWKI